MINQRLHQIFSGRPCLAAILLLAIVPTATNAETSDPNAKIIFEAGRTTFAPGELVKIRFQGKAKDTDTGRDRIGIRAWGSLDFKFLRKRLTKNAKVNEEFQFMPPGPGRYIVNWDYYGIEHNYIPSHRASAVITVKAGFTAKKTGSTVKEAQDLLDDIATIQVLAPRMNAGLKSYCKVVIDTRKEGLRAVMPRFKKIEADFRELATNLEKTAKTAKVVEVASAISKVATEFRGLADGIKALDRHTNSGDLSQANKTYNKMVASTKSLTAAIKTFVKKRYEAKVLAAQLKMKSLEKPHRPKLKGEYFEPDVSSD